MYRKNITGGRREAVVQDSMQHGRSGRGWSGVEERRKERLDEPGKEEAEREEIVFDCVPVI
jgi:hypothetical protein